MFAVYSHNSALQPLTIVRVLHINLLPSPLQLQLMVEALSGLLRVEAEAMLLPHHLQELFSMGFQQVHLRDKMASTNIFFRFKIYGNSV